MHCTFLARLNVAERVFHQELNIYMYAYVLLHISVMELRLILGFRLLYSPQINLLGFRLLYSPQIDLHDRM